jgi:hypothetical protein
MDTQLLRNRPAYTLDRAMAGGRGQSCLPRRARFALCGAADFQGKLLTAMRCGLRGHREKPAK